MKKVLLTSLITLLSVSAFADDAAKKEEAPAAEAAKTEAPAPAAAEVCKVVIEANDAMQFNKDTFTIKKDECAEFTVELDNVGTMAANVMGHNVVMTKAADMQGVATDGLTAKTDHVKEGDERVIAHTKVIGGGEKDAVTFKTDAFEKGGDYAFFCTFPGHASIMKGKIVVE